MKRLWLAAAILGLLFAAALVNTNYLKGFTADLTALLEQAEAKAEEDSWEAAGALTRLALQKWQSRDAYLRVAFRHGDVDAVSTDFREALEFIRCRETADHAAANARLIARLRLLYEAERLTLKNIL